MMRQTHLKRFKKMFETQVQSFSTPSASQSIPTHFDEPGDLVDRVSVMQEQSLNDTLEHRKRVLIRGAATALQRIELGTFGVCEDCDEDIDLRRLEINPTTTVCIQCQEERERYALMKSAV